jgi:toxin FitB
MRVYDSNLLIYSFQPAYDFLQADLLQPDVCVSIITKLEVLGYPSITEPEKAYFEWLFSLIKVLPIDFEIVDKAINLRQTRKMSLGDSIVAATTLIKNFPIYTHNTVDFKWIRGLTIIDPLA